MGDGMDRLPDGCLVMRCEEWRLRGWTVGLLLLGAWWGGACWGLMCFLYSVIYFYLDVVFITRCCIFSFRSVVQVIHF